MTINKTKADNIITLALEGRLDTTTAPELDKEIDVVMEAKTKEIMTVEAPLPDDIKNIMCI